MDDLGPFSHLTTEIYGEKISCPDIDKQKFHIHHPTDKTTALNRAINRWQKHHKKVQPSTEIVFPTDLESCGNRNFQQVYAAIAAVTFAQDAGLNTLVDTEGILAYCLAHRGQQTLENMVSWRIATLNDRARFDHPTWPGAGCPGRLIIPWHIRDHFVTLVIYSAPSRKARESLSHQLGWTILMYDSTSRARSMLEDPDLEKSVVAGVKAMLRDLRWFRGVDPEAMQPKGIHVQPTAKQLPRLNHCGVHTVLNAWAVALGQKINPKFITKPEFIRQSVNLIDLALAGHMDSDTTLMFLRAWEFVELDHFNGSICPYRFARTVPTGINTSVVPKCYIDRVKQDILRG